MDVRKAIETRRAYRSLDPVEIDRATIEDLARCAILAPSCFNNQPERFDFVIGETLGKLKEALSKGNAWARDASMIIAVHATLEDDCQVKERQYFLFDTGMATAMLILRATELGLVAHPIAGFDETVARGVLDIPQAARVITLIIVGRHAGTIRPSLSEKQAAAEGERPERLGFDEYARIFD
jgi:nitroreductase